MDCDEGYTAEPADDHPKCKACGINIPEARLEALPNVKTCVDHSDETPYFGLEVYPHKTGGFVIKTKLENQEQVRQMKRAYKRSR